MSVPPRHSFIVALALLAPATADRHPHPGLCQPHRLHAMGLQDTYCCF